jgi:predicted SAM-dependent methyltransferase
MIRRLVAKFRRDGLLKLIESAPRYLKNVVGQVIRFLMRKLGFELLKISNYSNLRSKGVYLNVGCGEYEIQGFTSVDYYSEAYYSNKKFNRVHYDMRNDNLPYADNSVDAIYCSHVIEHIETLHVEKFFQESCRALKPGGILRICCPDAEYLFSNLKDSPEYFSWHPLYKNTDDALVCFVDEVGSPKVEKHNFGLQRNWFEYTYDELLKELRSDLEFNERSPGMHINSWDFERIFGLAKSVGFSSVTKSRFQGSFKEELRGTDMDLTHPEMSLYVDLKK